MDFVFVVEMAGFQHGDLPFALKRMTIAPVRDGPPHKLTFDMMFLLDENPRAMHTFTFQTTNIHGISIDEPGISYERRRDAILTIIKA